MKLSDLQANPLFLEHWGGSSGPILAFLTEKLIETCANSECGDGSQAEASEHKSIALLIRDFRNISAVKPESKSSIRMPVLNSMKPKETPPTQ